AVHAPGSAFSFAFDVALTPDLGNTPRNNVAVGTTLGFARYDAVVLLHDLGRISGQSIGRWPHAHPAFYGQGFVLELNPNALSPGLLGNELLRRNLPVLLSEYRMGEPR